MTLPLWLLAEIAICATDLAEVIGTAIGLNLLFAIPLELGVLITALDVFLIPWLQNLGFRWVEAFVINMLAVITVCFGIQIFMADPDWGAAIRDFAPTTNIITNPDCSIWPLGYSAPPSCRITCTCIPVLCKPSVMAILSEKNARPYAWPPGTPRLRSCLRC